MRRILSAILIVVVLVATAWPGVDTSWAQGKPRLQLIRDTEIENIIRAYARPLLQAAGLSPDNITVHLVKDKALNAFVTNGKNLFIHTGLIRRAENPGQIVGVLAHEIGHMANADTIELRQELEAAQSNSILAMVLGAALGVATQNAQVGQAVMMGGQTAAERNLLSFSREQESAADQAAIRLLDATDQSAAGLVEFFDILGDQEILLPGQQDPYVRTHPLTRDRVAFVRHHVEAVEASRPAPPAVHAEWLARMQAKLDGFFDAPIKTLGRYAADDPSLAARYARAIAYFRQGDLVHALPLMDGLIAERPDDPYFWEIKGQALFETGRVRDAVAPYEKSVELDPEAPLLRIGLGRALIESGDEASIKAARPHLRAAVDADPGNAFAWHQLGIAYGRPGDVPGLAAWARAEYSALLKKWPEARFHATKALDSLTPGMPERLRTQDLLAHLEQVAPVPGQ